MMIGSMLLQTFVVTISENTRECATLVHEVSSCRELKLNTTKLDSGGEGIITY